MYAGSFAKAPQPECEPQSMAAALPMVTGSKEVHEIPVTVERYADNPIEADHADSHRLRSMHGR